jgi:hypothetical protein
MTGLCPFCGGTYKTDPRNCTYEACCEKQEEILGDQAGMELDQREERDWELMNGYND